MPPYNPKYHHRRSIRLKGYDYTQAGLYFITICCQNRACLFGEIVNHEMILNDAGKMVLKWYYELENKFADIRCHEIIVMPNHVHFIIENAVGADLRVCPHDISDAHVGADLRVCPLKDSDEHIGSPVRVGLDDNYGEKDNPGEGDKSVEHRDAGEHGNSGEHGDSGEHGNAGEHGNGGEHGEVGEHKGSPLSRVVQWFKTMSTNEYIRGVKNNNWQRFAGKLWQRNYYERIIRNDKAYQTISQYIINNPSKWNKDTIHKE